jgi:hypothetical protein
MLSGSRSTLWIFRDLSKTTLNDIPYAERCNWQSARGIQSCDGDLTHEDEIDLHNDWREAQCLHRAIGCDTNRQFDKVSPP